MNDDSTGVEFRKQSLWLQGLRWVAALPTAILGSLFAFWIIRSFFWVGWAIHDDKTWDHYIWQEILSHIIMGFTFVSCAALVAPRFKVTTAFVSAGLLLSLFGGVLLLALFGKQYMSVLASVCVNAGAIGAAIVIFKNEGDLKSIIPHSQ